MKMKNRKVFLTGIGILFLTIATATNAVADEVIKINTFRNITTGSKYVNVREKTINKSWINIDGNWYYINEKGEKETGWIKYNNNNYYLDKDGIMLHDTIVEGQKLGSSGAAEGVTE